MDRVKISYVSLLVLLLAGCKLPVEEIGPPDNFYFGGPSNISVQSMSESKVKISWASGYNANVIVERSEFKDSLFSVIQKNVSGNYFYDSNLVISRSYYYRFRGFTLNDTSFYSYLTIGYDSSSRLLQTLSTNKNSSSMTISDDGTLISVVNPDWGGFEIRRYSDLSLVATRNRGNLIGNVGSETRFSADANKILTWSFNYATSITLSPYSETSLQIPDSIGFLDMYYIANDTKILALASTYQSQQPFVYVFDLQTKTFVQQIDTLQNTFFYGTSSISNGRSKIIIQTSVGFYVISISQALSIDHFVLSPSYSRYSFLSDPDSMIGVGYSSFAFINTESGRVYKSIPTAIYNINRIVLYPDDSKIIVYDSYVRDVSIYSLITGTREQRVGGINPDLTVSGVCCGMNEQSFIILYSNGTINKYSAIDFVKGWQKEDN